MISEQNAFGIVGSSTEDGLKDSEQDTDSLVREEAVDQEQSAQ